MSEFLLDLGRPEEGDGDWSSCYTCGVRKRMGSCACCDLGLGPRCAICRMGPVKLPVCKCGRIRLRDTDELCPRCDPSVFKVVGRTTL